VVDRRDHQAAVSASDARIRASGPALRLAGCLAISLLACSLGAASPAPADEANADAHSVDEGGGSAAAPLPEADDAPARPPNPDPWEGFNRAIFQLNEWGDIYFVTPMAEGWRFMTPSFFRSSVTHFNDNLQMPVILGNNLLQLKPAHVGEDFLRFFFNISFGLGGLIDTATYIDIPQNDEDFGQTLGYWGTPSGPYLVLPVYGPSTVRDGVGRLADSAGTLYFSFLPFYSTLLVRGVEIVNLRSAYIEEIDANRAESFDYYVFLRNAYLQNRRAKVDAPRSRSRDAESEEDLYHLDDDLFDDDLDEDYDVEDGEVNDEGLDGALEEDGGASMSPPPSARDADASMRIDAWRRAA
jgi:phospholipid-binding lipoprotein MlaA